MCGDVTHLKKDCPQYQAQQQKTENTMKLQTFGGSNPEELDVPSDTKRFEGPKKQNKIIKFA